MSVRFDSIELLPPEQEESINHNKSALTSRSVKIAFDNTEYTVVAESFD